MERLKTLSRKTDTAHAAKGKVEGVMKTAGRARMRKGCTALTTEAHAMGAFKSAFWAGHNTIKGASVIPKAPF